MLYYSYAIFCSLHYCFATFIKHRIVYKVNVLPGYQSLAYSGG